MDLLDAIIKNLGFDYWRWFIVDGQAVIIAVIPAILLIVLGIHLKKNFLKNTLRQLTRFLDSPGRAAPALFTLVLAYFIISFHVYEPEPMIHDEFSYLLAGDMMAGGHLACPPHPLKPFFETFHVLIEPAYVSKYPPAQGMFLALGFKLGHPVRGVWLSIVLASLALYWFFLPWLGPRWAFLGGLLPVLHSQIALGWGMTFWGGAPAMLGGTLLFGAVYRLLYNPGWSSLVWLNIGVIILLNSRPFEGTLAILPAMIVLLYGAFAKKSPFPFSGRPLRELLIRKGVPLALLLQGLNLMWMMAYNYEATSDPFRLPYQEYIEQYEIGTPFIFSDSGRSIIYSNEWLETFWEEMRNSNREARTVSGFIKLVGAKTWSIVRFFFGGIFLLPFCFSLFRRGNSWLKFIKWAVGIQIAASMLVIAGFPHYLAPAAVLFFGLSFHTLAQWAADARNGYLSRKLILTVLVISLLSKPLILFGSLDNLGNANIQKYRPQHTRQLREEGGSHVILVKYGSNHNPHREWVYNRADIDEASIIWARDRGPAENRKIFDYYPTRRFWLLEPDDAPQTLHPIQTSPEILDRSHAFRPDNQGGSTR